VSARRKSSRQTLMSGPDPSQDDGRHHPIDPYAPVDYPTDYPLPPGYPPMPPPVHPAWYPGHGYYPPAPYGSPGPYGPYGPYGGGVPPGTNGKAIAALVCALTGLVVCMCFVPSLAAIVLGLLAMAETRRTGQAGYGLAVAGVVVGVCTVLFGTALFYVGFSGS
jgi:Domain of unknown function (DUF4190)